MASNAIGSLADAERMTMEGAVAADANATAQRLRILWDYVLAAFNNVDKIDDAATIANLFNGGHQITGDISDAVGLMKTRCHLLLRTLLTQAAQWTYTHFVPQAREVESLMLQSPFEVDDDDVRSCCFKNWLETASGKQWLQSSSGARYVSLTRSMGNVDIVTKLATSANISLPVIPPMPDIDTTVLKRIFCFRFVHDDNFMYNEKVVHDDLVMPPAWPSSVSFQRLLTSAMYKSMPTSLAVCTLHVGYCSFTSTDAKAFDLSAMLQRMLHHDNANSEKMCRDLFCKCTVPLSDVDLERVCGRLSRYDASACSCGRATHGGWTRCRSCVRAAILSVAQRRSGRMYFRHQRRQATHSDIIGEYGTYDKEESSEKVRRHIASIYNHDSALDSSWFSFWSPFHLLEAAFDVYGNRHWTGLQNGADVIRSCVRSVAIVYAMLTDNLCAEILCTQDVPIELAIVYDYKQSVFSDSPIVCPDEVSSAHSRRPSALLNPDSDFRLLCTRKCPYIQRQTFGVREHYDWFKGDRGTHHGQVLDGRGRIRWKADVFLTKEVLRISNHVGDARAAVGEYRAIKNAVSSIDPYVASSSAFICGTMDIDAITQHIGSGG